MGQATGLVDGDITGLVTGQANVIVVQAPQAQVQHLLVDLKFLFYFIL